MAVEEGFEPSSSESKSDALTNCATRLYSRLSAIRNKYSTQSKGIAGVPILDLNEAPSHSP